MPPYLLFLCLLFGLTNTSHATSNTLSLSDAKDDYPLAHYIHFFEDPSGELTFTDVIKPNNAKHFKKNLSEGLSLGYSSSIFWLRFSVLNKTSNDKRWLIQQNHTHTHYMTVYNQANAYRAQYSGTLVPLAQRDDKHREITFAANLPHNKTQTIYIRLQTHGAVSLDINVLTQQAFMEKNAKITFVLGLFYGLLLIIIIYNLFFFASLKDPGYLYLALFVIFFGSVYILYDGLGQLFLPSTFLASTPYLVPMLMGLTSVAILLHRRAFLSTTSNNRIDNLLFISWLLIISLTPFINLTSAVITTILLLLLTATYIFLSTIRCWNTHDTAIRFAAVGWAIFCTSILLMGLARLQILPDYFFFEHLVRLGLVTLVLLLSIALVKRINQLKLTSEKSNTALRGAETQRNLALDAAQLGIWHWKIAADIIDWSERSCQIFGITQDNAPRKFEDLKTIVHPDDFKYLENVVEEAISKHQPYSLQFRIIRGNGKEVWVQCYGKVELDENNNLLGITGTLQDITQQKRLEAEKQRYEDQLENAVNHRTTELKTVNKELESFSYSVSHDLRSPLRAINGYSKLLSDSCKDKLNEEDNELLRRIRKNTARMGKLIDHLLNLSRITRTKLQFEDVDLGKIAIEIIGNLHNSEPERQVEFKCSVTSIAHADAGLARIALENLIENSWKYSSKVEHAVIEFGETTKNDETIYFIKDNGAGFDMTYSDKLFGAFQRLHGKEFEGSGIGLATVQGIVHRHQGTIWGDSRPNEGTTFFFTFGKSGLG